MGRHNRPRRAAPRPAASAGAGGGGGARMAREWTQQRAGSLWHVRSVTGSALGKTYTCPGCSRPIPPQTAHLVVWPDSDAHWRSRGVEDRRHWHSGCWERG